jgi:hypothetical protein
LRRTPGATLARSHLISQRERRPVVTSCQRTSKRTGCASSEDQPRVPTLRRLTDTFSSEPASTVDGTPLAEIAAASPARRTDRCGRGVAARCVIAPPRPKGQGANCSVVPHGAVSQVG